MKKKNKVTSKDLYRFKFPYNLSYNTSGDALAFTVTYCDKQKDNYHSDVYLIKDNKVKQLTATLNAKNLVWLNNDELLLNRDDGKEGSSIFKINIGGGEASNFMSLPFSLLSLKVISEDKFVALGYIDANNPDAYLDDEEKRKEKKALKEKEKDYQVIDEIPYWRNGQGFTNKRRTALFLIDKDKIKRITKTYEDVREYELDGNNLYYSAITWKSKYSLNSNIYKYDLKTKKNKTIYGKSDLAINNLFVKEHKLYGQVSDGKKHGSHQTGVISLISEKGIKTIVDPDRSLHDSASGDTTYGSGKQAVVYKNEWFTLATNDDHVEIWKYDDKFNMKVLFAKQGVVTCLDANKEFVSFIHENDSHLLEVYTMNKDGSNLKMLTSFNEEWVKEKYIAKAKRIDFISTNTKLHGWVLLPEGFTSKKKYPAVLDVHGGPRAIYSTAISHEMQIWASLGFVVMFCNIRGSDGLGDDFANINGHYGDIDYQNLMDFTDAVLEKYPNIDKNKLCETGGSYGGFMTNWIIGHTNRFCCAASQRSISNWTTKIFLSDIGFWYNAEQHGVENNTVKDAYKLWQFSPLKYANNVKTPTLFIHSDEDYRCPLPEGMQMMQALAYKGVETRMCIFHGESHGLCVIGKPTHRIRRLDEISNWFISHTK